MIDQEMYGGVCGRLAAVRRGKKMTRERLAATAKVDEATVEKIENGSEDVTVRDLLQVANALGRYLEMQLHDCW